MFLDSHTLSPLPMSITGFSDADYDALAGAASHCCPNCDGELSLYEDRAFGICQPCNFGLDD